MIEEESEGLRYPKRCRMKPTKYWESERVNYKEGKVVGISNAQVDFLKLIGANESYETSININFQNNNIEAEVILPPMKTLSCRGFTDPYKTLTIQLAARDFKSSSVQRNMLTVDDGVETLDLITT